MLHLIYRIDTRDEIAEPLRLYLGGDAGYGKTYTVNLIKETYNMFSFTDGQYDAYIACGSTGESAVAIGRKTLHSTFSLQNGQKKQDDFSISCEKLYAYRTLMKFKKVLIIDEVSMVPSETLTIINQKLKRILVNSDQLFGG